MASYIFSSNAPYRGFVFAFGLTFLLGAVVFVAATEILVRERVVQFDPYYQYIQLFRGSTSDDAAFGDSHVMAGFVGQPGFVNLASGGENFDAIAEKVRLYFATRKPHHVILQAGLHHFSRAIRQKKAEGFAHLLAGGNEQPLYLAREIHRYELLTYWRIFLSGKEFVPVRRFQPDGARLTDQRFAETPIEIRRQAARQDAVVNQPLENPGSSSVADAYRQLLGWLKERGAEACLVTFPASPELRDAASKLPSYAAARRFFGRLAVDYGVPYIDLFDADLDIEFFADSHHLNARGARDISPQIVQKCFGHAPLSAQR